MKDSQRAGPKMLTLEHPLCFSSEFLTNLVVSDIVLDYVRNYVAGGESEIRLSMSRNSEIFHFSTSALNTGPRLVSPVGPK